MDCAAHVHMHVGVRAGYVHSKLDMCDSKRGKREPRQSGLALRGVNAASNGSLPMSFVGPD